MDYYKYHALGNDYIVMDPRDVNTSLSKENIKLICDRNFGVGSDGILYGPIFEGDQIKVKILNPDGSEAEKSGNGIRIFSKYLLDLNYVKERSFKLQTVGGEVVVEYLDLKGNLIKVSMGIVTFVSNLIPMIGGEREVVNETFKIGEEFYKLTCLSIGNPHCVVLLDEISRELAMKIGPILENHESFPNRVNVQLLKVLDRKNIQIEIWERGAGYTMASGSSSCAAANAAFKLGLVDKEINVHMPGGIIEIEIQEDGSTFMTGSVCSVSVGNFTEEFKRKLN